MLVAGGIISLLLAGLAVDSVLSSDDPHEGDDLDREDDAGDELEDQSGVPGSGLSDLLFPEADGAATHASDAPATGGAQDSGTDMAAVSEDAADQQWQLAEESGFAEPTFLEATGFTTLSSGAEVSYVDDFQPETDALVLEFDGTSDETPTITINLVSEVGAAVIEANGLPVTLVEGVEDMTTDHVRVVMSGEAQPILPGVPFEAHASEPEGTAPLTDGGDGSDTIVVRSGGDAQAGGGDETFSDGEYIETAEFPDSFIDFDPVEDRIEVLFDPEVNPNPVIEVQDFADGSGADIILNGEVILKVSGAQGLDPSLIELRAVA